MDLKEAFTIHITKPIYGGMGMGHHEGKVVMVPGALPGEEAVVSPAKTGRDYMICTLLELVTPSQHRITPECPNFGICGGCDYLSVSHTYELQIKKEIALDSLRRTARLSQDEIPMVEVIGGDRRYYRSHADLKSCCGKPGFYRRETNTCIPFESAGCQLLAEKIMEGLCGVSLPSPGCRVALDHRGELHLEGDCSTVLECENGIFYDRDITSFFQVNRYLRPVIQQRMFEFAEMRSGDTFLDIGCGVGFFSLYFARQSFSGIGYDINSGSIAWARRNAALNGITGVQFIATSAEDIPIDGGGGATVVLLDPPRSGLSRRARDRVMAVSPKRIAYASCDPATFSRDIASFAGSGYSLTRLMLIDMFPATRHMELLGQLRR
ncbi:MAG: class I SAM-dependent RNA methyltransferase [Spirochaetes bacterium]|nr:class I SAM-dependent RNA methyltransferase [Spirochaetota bacterium]